MRGKNSEVGGMLSAMISMKTEYDRSTVIPSVTLTYNDTSVNLTTISVTHQHFSQFTTVRSRLYEKVAEKRCALRFDLKSCKVLDDVTSDGRLFHIFAAATGKANRTEPWYSQC